jgi:hypothetical protein
MRSMLRAGDVRQVVLIEIDAHNRFMRSDAHTVAWRQDWRSTAMTRLRARSGKGGARRSCGLA